MTTYTMTGPDGKDYSIDGPPGASMADVAAQMQAAHSAVAAPKSGGVDTNSFVDAARSVPGGLAQGAAQIVGGPGSAIEMVSQMLPRAANAIYSGAGDALANAGKFLGLGLRHVPTGNEVSAAFSAPTGGYYKPKTTAGEYAQTISSFAPAAFLPTSAESTAGDIAQRAARVLVPGAFSETGGQLYKGTPYEGAARSVGALAGAGVETLGELGYSAAGFGRGMTAEEQAQNLIAQRLAEDKVTPENAGQTLSQFGNKPSTVMDVGGPSTARLARTVATLPGEGSANLTKFLTDRQADQNGRVLQDITSNLANGSDVHGIAQRLIAQQEAEAAPLYRAAHEANPNISSPKIDEILQTDAGKKALAQARTLMSNARRPMTSAAPVEPVDAPRGPAPADVGPGDNTGTIYSAIRKLGGIKTNTNAGYLTPEGGDVRAALKDVRTSGLINNKTGLAPDVIHGLLDRQGWFGRNGSQDLNDLFDALRQGNDFAHPESVAASSSAAANARHLAETRSLADELGIEYKPHWDASHIESAFTNAERQAAGLDGRAPGLNLETLDYVKRALDDQISVAQRAGASTDASIKTGLKNDLLKALDAADSTASPMQPGLYARARSAFAGPAQSLDAIDAGKRFLDLPPEEIQTAVAKLPAANRNLYRIGAARALQDRINNAADSRDAVARVFGNFTIRKQIDATFGTGSATRFAEAMTPENAMTATNRLVLGGSNTMNKAADMGRSTGAKVAEDAATGFIVGGPKGAVTLPAINYARGKVAEFFHGMTPEVRAALADLLTRTGPQAQSTLNGIPLGADLAPNTLNRIPFGYPVMGALGYRPVAPAAPNSIYEPR